MWRGKFGVVPSPTPITPSSGLRTTRTLTLGILRFRERAAIRPALPAPRTIMLRIMGRYFRNKADARSRPILRGLKLPRRGLRGTGRRGGFPFQGESRSLRVEGSAMGVRSRADL